MKSLWLIPAVLLPALAVSTDSPFALRAGSHPTGDIIFITANGVEALRFKPDGKVIANPKLQPDEAARAVLSAMYRLSPGYFCNNPDERKP